MKLFDPTLKEAGALIKDFLDPRVKINVTYVPSQDKALYKYTNGKTTGLQFALSESTEALTFENSVDEYDESKAD